MLFIFNDGIDSDSSKEDDDIADPDFIAEPDEMLPINMDEDDPITALDDPITGLDEFNPDDSEANNDKQQIINQWSRLVVVLVVLYRASWCENGQDSHNPHQLSSNQAKI